MISGTQVLARMSDSVAQDQLNRHGLLVERLRQVSAKLDDIARKIDKACITDARKLPSLRALYERVETDRQGLIALMQQGRFVQPTTRSVSAHVKTALERKQGKAYSQSELAGRQLARPVEQEPRLKAGTKAKANAKSVQRGPHDHEYVWSSVKK